MNELLQQFISEARDCLQSVSELLLKLEQRPQDQQLVVELFRLVHTLKGNSGLFEFRAMTQVLHAAEDLMDAVRDGRLTFSPVLADPLLDTMDFVGYLVDQIAAQTYKNEEFIEQANKQSSVLREFISSINTSQSDESVENSELGYSHNPQEQALKENSELLKDLPDVILQQIELLSGSGYLVSYQPESGCFFKGEDPFYLVQQLPGLIWGAAVRASEVTLYDCYQSQLRYLALSKASEQEIAHHFRYVPEQVSWFNLSGGEAIGPAVTAIELDPAVTDILGIQLEILKLHQETGAPKGMLAAVFNTLNALKNQLPVGIPPLPQLTDESSSSQFSDWILSILSAKGAETNSVVELADHTAASPSLDATDHPTDDSLAENNSDSKFGRRAEDSTVGKVLKVEQSKIDRLMDLIGEIVVAKNGLPYLANKAETYYGNREISRDIKTQYAVINRIVEEMQDAIMQVRMMPVSFIFQRFPRLVRDIARKLGKEVDLQIQGEQTEADKTIIESLADPLIHILRNSLDHGLETAEERLKLGKSPQGVLKIHASQESDRVIILIEDDGRGIDPVAIKRKAWEKQLITEEQLEKMTDQEAIQLIFAAGFSTATQVTDLSGRGVGMDVVKTAVMRVGGSVQLSSEAGKGTRLSLSLPLSMAVTNVMVIASDQQTFGIPMDLIVETVRLPVSAVQYIKQTMTTVLRGKLIPLRSLNQLLSIDKAQLQNEEQEYALLVVRSQGEVLGLLVDDFYEVIDIILKPLPGELGNMSLYAGSALLGDGSVLLILNPKEFH